MEVRGRQLRVAVVGAGAAGLCAARHLAARPEAFAPPVVFEASAQLGGTWVYSEERPFGKGPPLPCNMYRDLRTNLPKEAMAFPDFPFEVALPSFLPRAAVLSYLEHYTESHGLRGYIRFQRLVKQVTPVDGPESGWDVTSSQATGGGEQETERFDAIMVCSGHYSTPFIPSISGLETFTGQVLHSRDYRCPEPFAGHSVVLVGAGPSGVDLAQQLAPLARCVTLSHSQAMPTACPSCLLPAWACAWGTTWWPHSTATSCRPSTRASSWWGCASRSAPSRTSTSRCSSAWLCSQVPACCPLPPSGRWQLRRSCGFTWLLGVPPGTSTAWACGSGATCRSWHSSGGFHHCPPSSRRFMMIRGSAAPRTLAATVTAITACLVPRSGSWWGEELWPPWGCAGSGDGVSWRGDGRGSCPSTAGEMGDTGPGQCWVLACPQD
ncbi:flavin-containing monooxygenase FMO GS-OX3-like isoform X3 [Alligator sinensis]|nr:flavin-containing monooxygenase FMO GS-OX3-like isoform X3 [Alligator sinensis]XP_025066899.1 flavin-containing monooxygenase FMO GS-OX3-like isoform X3 [Alligator sinensis]